MEEREQVINVAPPNNLKYKGRKHDKRKQSSLDIQAMTLTRTNSFNLTPAFIRDSVSHI